ncbi:ATP-dependent DNA helicase PIF1-like protein [Tanacetum coccineum]
MLLNVVRGARSFEAMMMVNKKQYATFKAACSAYGLLNDDKEWPHLTYDELRNYCLLEIQELLNRNVKSLTECQDLPQPNPKLLTNPYNRLIREAMDFDMNKSIASLLLPGDRNAHSRFVIPLELMENNTCNIKQNTHLAELMQQVHLIIWDEAPMTQRYAFEALDKMLRDILGMRRNGYSKNGETDIRKQTFNRWVLAVGDGKLPAKTKEGEDEPTWIEIPEEFLIKLWNSPIEQIVSNTYPNFTTRQTDNEYLKERSILTLRNDDADVINEYMFKNLGGAPVTYNSADEICKASMDTLDQHHLYLVEFLNSLNFSGMPPYAICLKKELPIMLIQNVNPS